MKSASLRLRRMLHHESVGGVAFTGGLNSCADVPAAASLNVAALTWEVFFQYGGAQANLYPRIVAKQDTVLGIDYFSATPNRLRAWVNAGGVRSGELYGSPMSQGEWCHAVLTYDGATVCLYQNGSLVGSVAKTGILDLTVGGALGIASAPGNGGSGFVGTLDYVRMYNRALSAAEVVKLFADVPASVGLVGEWLCDEAGGASLNDTSGNGNHGSLYSLAVGQRTVLSSMSSYVMADLYTLTLLGGTVLRYTNFDVDLTANGVVYAANSLKFRRDRVRWIAGLEVDTLGVTVHAGPSDLLNGVSFLAQVERGAVVTAWPEVIHAYRPERAVVLGSGLQLELADRPVRFYSIWKMRR